MSLVFPTTPLPPLSTVGVSAVNPSELDVLARTVWGEARGESLAGQIAVAWVVMNRVIAARKDRAKFLWWGETVQRVCLAPAQFSCWLESDPNREKLGAAHLGQTTFARAFGAACLVVSGNVSDPTDGATHYFADSIPPPAWTVPMTPRARIGAHSFFREPSWS